MKKTQKLLSIVVSLMLVLGAFPFSLIASAEETGEAYSATLGQIYDSTAERAIHADVYNNLVTESSDIANFAAANISGVGNCLIPQINNVAQTLVFKYDVGEGYLLKDVSVNWKGRGIQNTKNFVNIYYGFTADRNGEWYYADGVGHADLGYASNNKEATFSLKDELGSGVQTLYIKAEVQRSQGSWGVLAKLNVSGTKVAGTLSADAADISIDGISGDSADVNIGAPLSFTALAVPPSISNTSVTAQIEDTTIASVTKSGNTFTLNGLKPGITKLILSSELTPEVSKEITVTVGGISNGYDSAVTADVANAVNSEDFLSLAENVAACPVANVSGAVLKFPAVSFASFIGTGANYIRATVAWGEGADAAASWDVYVDSVSTENRLATLYATPYGGGVTKQIANAYLDSSLYDTHDIYVVFNTVGSALYDITFANMPGDYTDTIDQTYSYTTDYKWTKNVINYNGLYKETGGLTSAQNGTATVIYRLDAGEGRELTAADIKLSFRNIKGTGSVYGTFKISVSTDLNNWTELYVHDGSNGDVSNTDPKKYPATLNEVDSLLGAGSAYIKISVSRTCGNGTTSWHSAFGIYLKGTSVATADVVKGDADNDGAVTVIDLIRFKKAAANVETEIADTAYFAGKNNLASDLIYVRKTLLSVDFEINRDRYNPVTAQTVVIDDNSTTPSVFEAFNLAPASDELEAATINSSRINYCLNNYGICLLQSGATYDLADYVRITSANSTISTVGEEKANLEFWGDANYTIKIGGANAVVSNLSVNMNNCYASLTGMSLDCSVIAISAANASIDNCIIEGGPNPETKDIVFFDSASRSTGVYFLSGSAGSNVKNSVIRNCFYGVIFHDSLGNGSGCTVDNCDISYNRADGVTFSGYGIVKNSRISYNGYDCLNGGSDGIPIPGAGVYTESNSNGFVVDGCEIFRNNGYNIDINRGSNITITNNLIYDSGWTQFPLAEDYQSVSYRNGVSLALTGLANSTVTGNTVTNSEAYNRLDQSYAHTHTGQDVNGSFGYANNGTAFSDLPTGGASVVACFLAYNSTGNTIEENTFVSSVADSDITGYGLFISYDCASDNVIEDNIVTGCETGIVDAR